MCAGDDACFVLGTLVFGLYSYFLCFFFRSSFKFIDRLLAVVLESVSGKVINIPIFRHAFFLMNFF